MNIHLTKSQIGSTACPLPKPWLSHVDGERGELIIAGDRVASLAGKSSFESVTARLWSGATGRLTDEAQCPRESRRGAPSAPLPACPICCRRREACRVVDGFRAGDRGPARRERARARGDDRRRIPRHRRRAGAAREGRRSRGARSRRVSHAADTLKMLHNRKADPRESRGARCLSRHRQRSRHERLDLHHARGRLDAGRFVCGRHRRLLRADRPAAWRRAGAGAGNARCDRHARAHRAWVDDALTRGERLMGSGHRVYRVRDPRADVLKVAIESSPAKAPTFPSLAKSRPISARRLRKKNPGPAAGDQCRVLHRDPARCAENPAAGVSRRSLRSPRRRLDRARAGAARASAG